LCGYSPDMNDAEQPAEATVPDAPPTPDDAKPAPHRLGYLRTRTFGTWTCRVLSLGGIALVILSLTGWWLSTRVLSDDGFGDVVAKTAQQQAVRDYIGDQATLRLAGENKLITAARPVVAKAVAEAISNPAVISAIHAFAAGAHHQLFQVNDQLRADVAAQTAAITIRNTLHSIDPALAEKLPENVLTTTADLSQSSVVDAAAKASLWVPVVYVPVGIIGIGVLLLAFAKARDPVRAVRFTGFTMAIAGALPIGLGIATPLFALVGANVDPNRGPAVAAFIKVLLGRLVAAGWAVTIVGLLLAFAPGRDGASLGVRLIRIREWFRSVRVRPLWQLAGAIVLVWAAVFLMTRPAQLLYWLGLIAAMVATYAAIVVILRLIGIVRSGQAVRRVRKRQIGAVLGAIVACVAVTTTATAVVVAKTNEAAKANPKSEGCNGSVELCMERLNQIVWAGSHNSMSSSAYNFFGAEHTLSIPEQLNEGARALLIDAYYGYPQSGIVRTNLAGGANRADIQSEFGNDAVKELDRLGALTGTADTSGNKQDVYLCHDYCELGAIKAATVFKQINDFLNRNLTDVLILDVEDYVQPADLEKALKQGNLWDRVYTPDLSKPLPTLLDMVNPPDGQDQAKRRVIITSERHPSQAPWLVGSYQLMQESPFTFTAISQFNCKPNRGQSTNAMLLVNHWLRPNGPPDPEEASKVNSLATLTDRLEKCIDTRKRLPNVLAVDFFGIGDTLKVVDNFNAAVANVTGTTAFWDQQISDQRNDPNVSSVDRAALDQLQRLPGITNQQAQALLGRDLANWLEVPELVKDFQEIDSLSGESSAPASSGSSSVTPANGPS
jgi:hypothetical protein